jgi:hypothetical protein
LLSEPRPRVMDDLVLTVAKTEIESRHTQPTTHRKRTQHKGHGSFTRTAPHRTDHKPRRRQPTNAQGISQPTHSDKSLVLRAIRDETKATSSHLARPRPAVLGFVLVIHHASPELASGCACFTADHDTVFRNPSRWNTEWYGGRHLLGALPRRPEPCILSLCSICAPFHS